jgi:hypothetical protein
VAPARFQGPSWAESSGGSGILDIRQIGKFVIFAMDITIVITWVFNNTKGSPLMAMLMDASIDTFKCAPKVALWPCRRIQQPSAQLWVVSAVARRLDSRRLGYQHYRPEEPDPATAPT